jgi:hypothetical protein
MFVFSARRGHDTDKVINMKRIREFMRALYTKILKLNDSCISNPEIPKFQMNREPRRSFRLPLDLNLYDRHPRANPAAEDGLEFYARYIRRTLSGGFWITLACLRNRRLFSLRKKIQPNFFMTHIPPCNPALALSEALTSFYFHGIKISIFKGFGIIGAMPMPVRN